MKKCLLLLLLSFLFFSCSTPVIELSSSDSVDSIVKQFGTPTIRSVSNGLPGEIVLKWESVPNSIGYKVYVLNDSFEASESYFVKKTEYSYKVKPGIKKFFYVTAVTRENGKEIESLASKIFQGVSLARPEITNIEEDSENNEVRLYWFMKSEELYKERITYEIECKNSKGEEIVKSINATDLPDGNVVIFSGLHKDLYQVNVKAYSSAARNKPIASLVKEKNITGYLISPPVITSSIPSLVSPNVMKVKLNLTWSDNSKKSDVEYFLKTEQVRPYKDGEPCPPPDIRKISTADLDALEYTVDFSDLSKKNELRGYYVWTLYIVEKNTESLDDETKIIAEASTQEVLVTNNVLKYPKFTVIDGYKDKIEIQIDDADQGNADITYELVRQEPGFDDKKNLLLEKVGGVYKVVTDTNLRAGATYQYTLKRLYMDEGEAIETKTMLIGQTMGEIGAISFDENSVQQSSITVTWPIVTGAKEYYVSLYDDGKSTPLTGWNNIKIDYNSEFGVDCENLNMNVSLSSDKKTIILKMEKVPHYNKPTESGKPMRCYVVAKSSKDSSATYIDDVKTLGPALTNPQFNENSLKESEITISWKPIKGATKYKIRRIGMKMTNSEEREPSIQEKIFEVAPTEKNIDNRFEFTDRANSGEAEILSYGYPFRYEVFPVDDRADISIYGAEEESVFTVGSTLGLGLDVLATKSESATEIKVSWKKPFNAARGKPVVWVQRDGGGWIKADDYFTFDSVAEGEVPVSGVYKPAPQYKASYFKFAVSYSGNLSTQESIDKRSQYLQILEADKIPEINESKNKGYLFALNIKGDIDPTDNFAEIISWEPWDYEQRKIGFDGNGNSYELWLLSNDYGTGEKLGDVTSSGITLIDDETQARLNIILTAGDDGKSVKIKPRNVTSLGGNNDIYEGLLKVLRDYRHMPYFVGSRTLSDSSVVNLPDADPGVYAYRNVTDAEFARAALLVMTYGFYKNAGGDDDYSKVDSDCRIGQEGTHGSEIEGSFYNSNGSIDGWYGINITYRHSFNASEYMPLMKNKAGTKTSFVKINISDSYLHRYDLTNGFLRLDDATVIDVSCVNSSIPIANGKVVITCNNDKNATIKVTREGKDEVQIVTKTTLDEFHKWFPIQCSKSNKWYLNNQTYYWW